MTERTTYAVWRDGAFHPRPGFHAARCSEWFGEGEVVALTVEQERNWASHRHAFAWLRSAWANLPEKYGTEPWAMSPEHLRKYALIKAGYCDTQTYVCTSRAEALRWAANLRPLDAYGIVIAQGVTVVRYAAQSQSAAAMGRAAFEASKTAILDFIAGLLGISPDELQRQEAA